MTNHHLIKIIKTFSRKEMTRFEEFAGSPYFNKHKGVRALTTYLSNIFPNLNAKKCARETIFQQLFPQKSHEQNQLALLFTYTLRLLEKFLIQEQFQTEVFNEKLCLFRSLRQRGLNLYYEKKLGHFSPFGKEFSDEWDAKLLKTPENTFKDAEFYQWQFHLNAEVDSYFSHQSQNKNGEFMKRKQFFLDNYYLSEKLRDACEMTLRRKIFKTEYPVGILNSLLQEIEVTEEKYAAVPPVIVYFKFYKLLNAKDSTAYETVLEVLKENEKWFPKAELQNLYNYLQNYCIEKINKGQRPFLKELFKIYQSQLEKELLLVDGFLPEWHYKNIVTTGLRLHENDWVLQFIESYKKCLKPAVLENAYSYNLAAYFYNTRQLEKVLDLLIKVEYTDIRYNLDAKSLLLRTYYDLKEDEALFSLVDSFRQFLTRNRMISEFQKRGYFNLLKLSKRAYQIKLKLNYSGKPKLKTDLARLKKEMAAAETIFNKGWLESKMEELSNYLN